MPDHSPQDQQERLLVPASETFHEVHQTDETTARTTDEEHGRIRFRLYTSHALSAWNSRLFEFGAFLFLAKIYPLTLLPASVYALARAAAAALISPWLGSYIDTADRLRAVRLSILGQRLPVVLSCIGFLIMLTYPNWTQSLAGKTLALSLLSGLACMEKLSAVLNTISVERDWVVVVAGTDEARLATMNAQMRRIDLVCKLLAPLAISLVDSYSTQVAALVTAALSIASVSVEYFAIARVYQAVPALREPKSSDKDTLDRQPVSTRDRLLGAATVVSTYVRHPAFLPSFALALLYLTVLSFSGQLITYLLAQDLNSASVALLRGVAALFELSATWLGPWLHRRIGAVRSGIWFLNAELLFVAIACGILWLPDERKSIIIVTPTLVTMVILSRTGLWGFDLSAQLIIQDEVESDVRGTFSSLEASCQNIFEMMAFLSTIVFPRPEEFKIPALISAGAVTTATLLFGYFVRKRRGHLLHASRCLERYQSSKHRHRSWEALPREELQDLGVDRETRA